MFGLKIWDVFIFNEFRFLYTIPFIFSFQNTNQKLDSCVDISDFFIVLYSIIDRTSFVEAAKIARYVHGSRSVHPTAVTLVATKRDLEHFREVSTTDGRELALQLRCAFYEISISESFADTLNMFKDALRQYVEYHPITLPCSPSSPRGSFNNLMQKEKEKEKSPPVSWSMMKGLRTTFRKKSVSVINSWAIVKQA